MAATTLTCKSGRIDKLHELLINEFKGQLQHECFIDEAPQLRSQNWGRSWRNAARGKQIVFYLWSKHEEQFPSFDRPDLPAVQLYEEEQYPLAIAWVSWVEKWQPERRGNDFQLKSASLVFSWGQATAIDGQLFRAEWDHSGSDDAAHPHWHIDWPINGIGTVSRIHLGMGGWGSPGESPMCWQRFAENDGALVEWASKTLCYGRQQLRDFPPKYGKYG